MKRLLLSLFISTTALAQSPSAFKYQAVVRGIDGFPLVEKNIQVRVSILKSSITGTAVFSELHAVKTSPLGVINLEIGRGTALTGTLNSIAWAEDEHFVKVEMDPSGGTTFELVGTSQLLSVPYALYAEKSGDEPWGKIAGGISYLEGNVGIGTSNPLATLSIAGLGSNLQIHKLEFKSTESVGKGRLEVKADISDLSNGYLTALDRFGDTSEDLIFGLQQPVDNSSSWNILESWRGAGLLISASGTESKPLLFGIDRIEKMRLDGNGNFGIGTSFPAYRLDVAGTINATGLLVNGQPVGAGPWSKNGNDTYVSSGKVGIGTANPAAQLTIAGPNSNLQIDKLEIKSAESAGKGRFEMKADVTDQSNGYLTALDRFGDASEDLIFGLQQPIGNSSSWNMMESWRGAGLFISASGTEGKPLLFGIDRVEKMRLDGNGNFGIGTSTPAYLLDVAGTINATSVLVNGQSISTPWSQESGNTILSSGNVGLGTSAPAFKLDVNGTVNATNYLLNGSQLVSSPWSLNSGDIYFSTGKVGIGTSSPTAQLSIMGGNGNLQVNKLEIKSTESESKGRFEIKADVADANNGYLTSLNRFGDSSEDLIFGLQQPLGNTQSWNIMESWRGAGLLISSSGTEGRPLLLGIDRVEKMRLNANGDVGIGTTDPKARLQVESGDVYLSAVGTGVIMKSPNGQCWRMTVSDAGAPVFTSITCP